MLTIKQKTYDGLAVASTSDELVRVLVSVAYNFRFTSGGSRRSVNVTQNVASILFVVKNTGARSQPIAVVSNFRDVGDKSGHSERLSIGAAIRQAINESWSPFDKSEFKPLEPTLSSQQYITPEEIKANPPLLGALREVEIHCFTERYPCYFKDDTKDKGCLPYLQELENLGITIYVYHHFPNFTRKHVAEEGLDKVMKDQKLIQAFIGSATLQPLTAAAAASQNPQSLAVTQSQITTLAAVGGLLVPPAINASEDFDEITYSQAEEAVRLSEEQQTFAPQPKEPATTEEQPPKAQKKQLGQEVHTQQLVSLDELFKQPTPAQPLATSSLILQTPSLAPPPPVANISQQQRGNTLLVDHGEKAIAPRPMILPMGGQVPPPMSSSPPAVLFSRPLTLVSLSGTTAPTPPTLPAAKSTLPSPGNKPSLA